MGRSPDFHVHFHVCLLLFFRCKACWLKKILQRSMDIHLSTFISLCDRLPVGRQPANLNILNFRGEIFLRLTGLDSIPTTVTSASSASKSRISNDQTLRLKVGKPAVRRRSVPDVITLDDSFEDGGFVDESGSPLPSVNSDVSSVSPRVPAGGMGISGQVQRVGDVKPLRECEVDYSDSDNEDLWEENHHGVEVSLGSERKCSLR